MFNIKNYLSVIILLISIFLVVSFNSYKVISTNLEAILPNSTNKDLLKKFNEFNISKQIFLYVDGLDSNSLKKIKSVEKEILKIDGINFYDNSKSFKAFEDNYYAYIYNLDIQKVKNLDIQKSLEVLKNNLLNSDFVFNVNKKDPFWLFSKQDEQISNLTIKNGHLAIKDMGYISFLSLDSSINNLVAYEDIYKKLEPFISSDEVKIFSSFFYFVENSQIIKDDVNKLVFIAMFVLITLYLIILRDLKLLFNSLIALSSSILFALFINSFIFEEISIFVLVFAISISTVAIDYMFHHYVHRHYEGKFRFNKDVFLGMLTTTIAFFIISFVDFDFIKQLCYFTIISLLFSYLQFAFLFALVKFKYKQRDILNFNIRYKISAFAVVVISTFLIIASYYSFTFDSNLKNLDVENRKLDELNSFFSTNISANNSVTYLIKAKSIDELIQNSKTIKNLINSSYIPFSKLISKDEFIQKQNILKTIDFENINKTINSEAKKLGFKDDFFKNSYKFENSFPKYSINYLKELNFDIFEYDNLYFTYITISQKEIHLLENIDFLEDINIKNMFETKLLQIKDSIFLYGFITILFIVLVVFFTYKNSILNYLAFLMFPFSLILILSLFISFNILHIFILFIILSISIDYGIYTSSYKKDLNTNRAIIYSISTTFAGFGVLIFSKNSALFSIGVATTIGILAILFLLIFLKKVN